MVQRVGVNRLAKKNWFIYNGEYSMVTVFVIVHSDNVTFVLKFAFNLIVITMKDLSF